MRSLTPALLLLALAACTGNIGEAPIEDPDREVELLPFAPADAAMQRLTIAQYTNAVHDVLGEDIAVPETLEADIPISGFVSIGASRTDISSSGTRNYETAAYAIAEQAMAPGARDALLPCAPGATVDRSCAEAGLRALGRRLFRRPLTDAEVTRYADVADDAAATLGDFHAGFVYALAGLLQSPHFLWRVEVGEPTGDEDRRRYTDFEMASRLSFVLWNTVPDEPLLAAAERGELTDDAGLRAQVDRMLLDDRSREAVRNFFAELLVLDHLAELEKDEALFPAYTQSLRGAAREETLRRIEQHVVDADADFRDLFTTYTTFVNRELADLYGLEGDFGPELEEVTLDPADGRRGLLGHASLLSIYAHAEKTSAAIRGRFVRQVLLCGNIPDPPDDVSTVFPPSDAPTLRERVEQHLMNDGCANCHALMDPIGLGLENFDASGAWRGTENDAPIDPSGVLDGEPFADAADLGRVVAQHPNVGECMTRSLLRYAVGEVERRPQEVAIRDLAAAFEEDGFRVRALLGAIVTSPAFREAGRPL